MMTSVRCTTCTTTDRDEEHVVPMSRAPSLVALSFSHDGSRVAYAVRRGEKLPRHGAFEDACCIFISDTSSCAPSVSRTPPAPGAAVTPLAQWRALQTLSGVHDAPITALSWCHRTGALLSTSSDRGACVWVPHADANTPKETLQASEKDLNGAAPVARENLGVCSSDMQDTLFCSVPQIVMLSVEVRSRPTSVAWSVEGTKLYIGTSGGTVAVGRYAARHKWWVCRLVEDCFPRGAHRDPSPDTSTPSSAGQRAVTALAAHPVDNTKVAVARLDGTVQVLSTHIKSVDGALAGSERSPSSDSAAVTGKPLNHAYLWHISPSWIHGIAWSPSGQQLAAVGHNSTLHVWSWRTSQSSPLSSPGEDHSNPENLTLPGSGTGRCEAARFDLQLSHLPLLRCEFVSEDVFVASGSEGRLYAFESSAPLSQSGVEIRRAWHLVTQHTLTRRVDGVQSAADTSTYPLSFETVDVGVEGREVETITSGVQTVLSRAAAPEVEGAHERPPQKQQQQVEVTEGPPTALHTTLVIELGGQHNVKSSERYGEAAGGNEADSPTPPKGDDDPLYTWHSNLLVHIPLSGTVAAADGKIDATYVSTGHEGRVHLWRVRSTNLVSGREGAALLR